MKSMMNIMNIEFMECILCMETIINITYEIVCSNVVYNPKTLHNATLRRFQQ